MLDRPYAGRSSDDMYAASGAARSWCDCIAAEAEAGDGDSEPLPKKLEFLLGVTLLGVVVIVADVAVEIGDGGILRGAGAI